MLLATAPSIRGADLLVTHIHGYTLDSHGKLQHFQALLADSRKVMATGTAMPNWRNARAMPV